MFFALLPSGLDVTQLAERSVWCTASAALGLFVAVAQVQTLWFFVRWTLIVAFLGVSIGAVLLWMQAGRKTLEKNRIDLRTYLKEMP